MRNLVAFVTFDFCANWKWKYWESTDNCSQNVSSHPRKFISGFQDKLGWWSSQEQIQSDSSGSLPQVRKMGLLLWKTTQMTSHIFRVIYEAFLIMNMSLYLLPMHILLELHFSVTSQLRNWFFKV